MFLEKIKTPGLSHLSYIIGSGGQAAVIDPRRDCEVYLEKARAEGLEITHIFETHRNEDLLSGSPILADLTGATVYHGPNAAGEIVFANTAREGDCFERRQKPNAFEDRDRAGIGRDPAGAHLSRQYRQINVRGRRLPCVSGT
ncbi:MBL fold metallo-hydrolase [Citromicrobium bathyomarinum]|jgi:hydroxyacylglutathione hydrolase|uniref:MBL fold metallo-hydrolase n=1 Tax=Tsuneonella suprasediminis TaxID=2306996 RepID=UPI001F0B7374|nr:MBL fold metallo-hydrolase [Tsuneonella suprasediminis]